MEEREKEEGGEECAERETTDCTLLCLFAGVIAGIVGWGWVGEWLEEKKGGVEKEEREEREGDGHWNGMREIARRMLRLT